MKDIILEIEGYRPYNEQEEVDKEIILSFIKENEDAFSRENKIAHMTSSCFIVNAAMDKVLLCFHNIYQSWSFFGGHADGDKDFLHVSLKEAKEETGLKHIIPYDDQIFSLECLAVSGHRKKNKYVSSHLHYNVTYLLIADEDEKLIVKEDENSSLAWFDLDDVLKVSNEKWFVNNVYPKMISKIKALKEKSVKQVLK